MMMSLDEYHIITQNVSMRVERTVRREEHNSMLPLTLLFVLPEVYGWSTLKLMLRYTIRGNVGTLCIGKLYADWLCRPCITKYIFVFFSPGVAFSLRGPSRAVSSPAGSADNTQHTPSTIFQKLGFSAWRRTYWVRRAVHRLMQPSRRKSFQIHHFRSVCLPFSGGNRVWNFVPGGVLSWWWYTICIGSEWWQNMTFGEIFDLIRPFFLKIFLDGLLSAEYMHRLVFISTRPKRSLVGLR